MRTFRRPKVESTAARPVFQDQAQQTITCEPSGFGNVGPDGAIVRLTI
jgi:hypothetical protein